MKIDIHNSLRFTLSRIHTHTLTQAYNKWEKLTHLDALMKVVIGIHVQRGEIPDHVKLESHLYRRPVPHRVVFPSDPFVVLCKRTISLNISQRRK